MKVVVAPDKFKGSLSAPEAARAIARGVASVVPRAEIDPAPMADGGEGTVEALVAATGGSFREAVVTGPLGEPIRASFGMLGDGRTAVVEMAAASGLVLVPRDRRDPWRATTRGTGELLLAALDAGARRVIVGIGGSATNDGGAGLGQALGYRLLDASGRDLGPGGGALGSLDRIDPGGRDPRLDGVEVAIACDVDNPLCGPRGASAVYGPQKGATPELVAALDRNLDHFARIVARDLGPAIRDLAGAGAAGGLGGGLVAFASGRLEPGVALVIDAVDLARRLEDADLCLTGEGAIDASSAFGKTAVGVARLARGLGCPTIALAGTIGPGAEAVLAEGIAAYFSLCPGPIALDEAIARGAELLENVAAQALRAFLAGGGEEDSPQSHKGHKDRHKEVGS
jgi:glycerate kinase